MNLEEIGNFLEENKDKSDVQSFLKGLVTADAVKGFLDTTDGKKMLQPKLDSYFTQGLETWKKNNLEKLIEDEVGKKFPAETPEQKALKQMQKELEEMKREKSLESVRNRAILLANEKKIPLELVNLLVSDNEETTLKALEVVEQTFTSQVQKLVDERFKANGRQVPGGQPQDYKGANPFAKDTFNLTEQGKLWRDNPDLAKQLQEQANN